MSDKTIRDLYLGNLRPANSRGFDTKIYREHIQKYDRLYDEVRAALPKEMQKKFDVMANECNEAECEVIIDAFVKGFQLGMSLTAEGLSLKEE